MADISKELEQIIKARYGREVRQSIYDGIKALNESYEAERQAAEKAQKAAETAQEKSETAQEASENAQKKSETARASAEAAQAVAEEKTKASQAAAEEAVQSAENAKLGAKLAQSYAVGGSGVREGEDEDNAKKYSEKAKSSADTSKEYLTKVEKAGEDALQVINDAINADVPNFIVDLSTGHLMYEGGRFNFEVDSNGHLLWRIAVEEDIKYE